MRDSVTDVTLAMQWRLYALPIRQVFTRVQTMFTQGRHCTEAGWRLAEEQEWFRTVDGYTCYQALGLHIGGIHVPHVSSLQHMPLHCLYRGGCFQVEILQLRKLIKVEREPEYSEMKELRQRSADYQKRSKKYTDRRRRARPFRVGVGDYVRFKLPTHHAKGTSSYGFPERVVDIAGPSTVTTSGGGCQNSQRLTQASPTAEYQSNIDDPNSGETVAPKQQPPTTPRRSTRTRRVPRRFPP